MSVVGFEPTRPKGQRILSSSIFFNYDGISNNTVNPSLYVAITKEGASDSLIRMEENDIKLHP